MFGDKNQRVENCIEYALALRENPLIWEFFQNPKTFTSEQFNALFANFDAVYVREKGRYPSPAALDILTRLARGELTEIDCEETRVYLSNHPVV